MQQILICLCNGGMLHIASQEKRLDPLEITKMISAAKITWVHATPSELTQWLRHGSAYLSRAANLRYVFSSGKALTETLVADFKTLMKPGFRLINVYGPAECGVVTGTEIDLTSVESQGPVSLGRPLSNIAVYTVDRNLKPVQAGVSGEIVIAGAGNIPSYLNQPLLPANAFVVDSLTPAGYYPGQLSALYRSGDMGRYDSNGRLYYEGRIAGDNQVKLNGIRVELQDIENSIVDTSSGSLTNAVVVVKRNPDFLMAFVEFVPDFSQSDRKEFTSILKKQLPMPRSMCPAVSVPLDTMPLNTHGKLDRRALEAMPIPRTDI